MKRHTYYKPCPECGANLDPQERCDCQKAEAAKQVEKPDYLKKPTDNEAA